MKQENKGSKSKYTIFTLIICIIAALSGKPISEIFTSDEPAAQETVMMDETYDDSFDLDAESEASNTTKDDSEDIASNENSDTLQDESATDSADFDTSSEMAKTDNAEISSDQESASTDQTVEEDTTSEEGADEEEIVFNDSAEEISDHTFRSQKLLDSHFEKHGLEMGFDSPEEYVENANRVISSPNVLHKLEAEDGDDIYYLEESNEFVVVSKDGYIRTYFQPSAGIDYYNRQ